MNKDEITLTELTRDVTEKIAIDYIVNDIPVTKIADKYHLSVKLINFIILRFSLVKKRAKYKDKVLDKALNKCATQQSHIIYQATDILKEHVDRLAEKAKKNKKQPLSSADVRDVMNILQIISKEYRLDNDKPTDKIVNAIEVQFPEGFAPITKNKDNIEDTEFTEVQGKKEEIEDKKEQIEDKEEEIEVEVSGVLENPLE